MSKSLVDSLISKLSTLEIREAILSDPQTQSMAQRWQQSDDVKQYFGAMNKEQMQRVLAATAFNPTAMSTSRWTQHFYGPTMTSKVRLTTFAKQSMMESSTTFYTNYTVLNEAATTVSPADLTGNVLVVNEPGASASTAYVKSPRSDAAAGNTLFVGRKSAGPYNTFSYSTSKAPLLAEGVKIKNYIHSYSNEIREKAFERLSHFCTSDELGILNYIKNTSTMHPILVDSMSFAAVDALNIMTSTSQTGSAKQACNSLLGHNYLTQEIFDEATLFSINPGLRKDIQSELQKISISTPPYINSWLPPISEFDDADKKAKSSSSIFGKNLNMFFTTFGTLLSKVSKSVGLTTAARLNPIEYMSKNSPEEKKDLLVSQMAEGKIYHANAADKQFLNCFNRVIWDTADNGNGSFTYRILTNMYSLTVNSDFTLGSSSSVLDIKASRLPVETTEYLISKSIKLTPSHTYSASTFLSLFRSTSSATVNEGNEDVLKQILQHKLSSPSARTSPIFDRRPDVLFASIPKFLLQLRQSSISVSTKSIHEIWALEEENIISDCLTSLSDLSKELQRNDNFTEVASSIRYTDGEFNATQMEYILKQVIDVCKQSNNVDKDESIFDVYRGIIALYNKDPKVFYTDEFDIETSEIDTITSIIEKRFSAHATSIRDYVDSLIVKLYTIDTDIKSLISTNTSLISNICYNMSNCFWFVKSATTLIPQSFNPLSIEKGSLEYVEDDRIQLHHKPKTQQKTSNAFKS